MEAKSFLLEFTHSTGIQKQKIVELLLSLFYPDNILNFTVS